MTANRVFVAEVDGCLSGLRDALFARFGHNLLGLDAVVLAHGGDDVVEGQFAALEVDGAGHDARSQLEVAIRHFMRFL